MSGAPTPSTNQTAFMAIAASAQPSNREESDSNRDVINQPSREPDDFNAIYVGINYRGLSRTQ